MSRLFDQFHRIIGNRRRHPGTELVRLGPAAPPPPAHSAPRALPAPEPRCELCGGRHAGAQARRGVSALYGQVISAEPGTSRPQPLGRGPGEDGAVQRDRFTAWR